MPGAIRAKLESRCVCEHHRNRHPNDGNCNAGMGMIGDCQCRKYRAYLEIKQALRGSK